MCKTDGLTFQFAHLVHQLQQIRKLNRFDVSPSKKTEQKGTSPDKKAITESSESSEETPSESVSATSSLR